ncbi:uncharacterized protein DEA37_0012683 [Paragonimus westermani]|uniref:Neurexin-4 n=1 Tax=Paragonimus westermani TaxID=34504 RepID=A0A5J4NI53_9TREM|nr:uncharacterized protein DEA37_0012683 [Paragonimus westermani]
MHFILRGRLRVNINLGAVPSSTEPTDNTVDAGSLLDDDQWHDVHIIREQKNLNISVDRIQVWRNLSAIFVHTNMNRNLSAGGLPHFSNRRGITVTQNFKGCIEEFIFNGVHLIRDAQRSLLGSQIVPAQDAATMRWDEALGYPKRNPFLWWGPPLTQNQLNITGFAIGGSGKLSTTCPPVTTDDSVIMFPGTKQYVVFLKIERESGTGTLQFSFQFRTLNRGGIMFYHTVDKDLNYISFGMEENKGHLELEIVLPGVNVIKYKIQNRDPAALDGTFADGLWHDVQFTMRKDEVTLIIDNIVHTTIQKTTLPANPSGVITVLPHDAPDFITVDGYQAPGSYRRKLVYDRADRETLGELVRRAVRCEQSITYQCWNAQLLRLPPGGGTTFQNRAWGWWVNRKGRPQFYWGGGVPGLQMCACGVEGTCTGDSLTCNCDSAGSTTPPLVDSGLLQFKDDLPVMEVRFGDTGGINDDKFSRYNVGPLRCFGDTLFDNTVTFRKADANLELPPLYSEFAFDMSFMFRTTITDAVIMQNNGRASSQFFEVRIRNGNSVRVAFNVGNGIQLVEVSTAHWLNDNTWHVVRFERNRKETRLIVDTQNPTTITEAIERSFRGFDFDQPLSVGTTQSFTDGFVGCLSNLLINGVVQDMRGLVERGVFTYGLSAGCVPKCEVNRCLNRGECVEHYSHYTCECGLTSYRGFICGREVGGTFNNGPMMKILLDRTQDRLGTVEEYIQVGFKTKSKRGILMEMRGSGDTNYIIVKVNNNGGITIEFDVGFKRFEVTTNYDIDLCNDQHHMVHAWRTDMGTKWHLKHGLRDFGVKIMQDNVIRTTHVDDYNEVVEDFSSYLSPSADVRLDDPWVIFMGRNDTMQAADGFDGCIYAAQWNNFFPLRMAFQDPRLANVQMLPAMVTGILLILTVVALVLFCRHFTIERGDYETKEAKDASRVKTADMAIQFGRTGQPEGAGAWVALDQDDQQWIQIDLKTRKVVTSIATQGKQGAQQWVQDYHVLYTDSDVPVYWSIIKDNLGQPMLFDGNTDDNGVKINNFTYAIVARYIRLNPQRWYNLIALRMELFGCEYRPFVANFDGTSWIDLRLDLPGRSTQTDRDEVRFRFRTREVNGLLLYGDSSQLDYFCIELYR